MPSPVNYQVPMTDIAFPDHEYLTVKELADLLRLKERKVYDLAASGQVPCSKATGKLLFPAGEIRQWIEQAKSGGGVTPGVSAARPRIVLGSHDPLLDWAIRQSRCGLASYYDGSMDGLQRYVRGEGVAAGMHLYDPDTDRWNVPAAVEQATGQNAVLVHFAKRQRGLVYRPTSLTPTGLKDLSGHRFVPRQGESGTDRLFRDLAVRDDLDVSSLRLTAVARTEDEAVESVRRGDADATFGLETVARSYGLEFLPIIQEEFALLVDRSAWFDPPMQSLLGFFATDQFQKRAHAVGGYDTSGQGTVLWNA